MFEIGLVALTLADAASVLDALYWGGLIIGGGLPSLLPIGMIELGRASSGRLMKSCVSRTQRGPSTTFPVRKFVQLPAGR